MAHLSEDFYAAMDRGRVDDDIARRFTQSAASAISEIDVEETRDSMCSPARTRYKVYEVQDGNPIEIPRE